MIEKSTGKQALKKEILFQIVLACVMWSKYLNPYPRSLHIQQATEYSSVLWDLFRIL